MPRLESATNRLIHALMGATSRMNSDTPTSEPSEDSSPAKEPGTEGSPKASGNGSSSSKTKSTNATSFKDLSELLKLLLMLGMMRNGNVPSPTSPEKVRRKPWRLLVPVLAVVVLAAAWWYFNS